MDDYLKTLQQIHKIYKNPAIKEVQQNALQIQKSLDSVRSAIEISTPIKIKTDYLFPAGLMEIHVETLELMERLEKGLNTKSLSDVTAIGKQLQSALNSLPKVDTSMLYHISRTLSYVEGLSILNVHAKDKNDATEDDTEEESNRVNEQIIGEIFEEDNNKIITPNSPIIHISPINDTVLKYLSEDPKRFYELSGNDFEDVMTEIYRRLGYNVERTKKTRDGGKDIIIRKPEILGDFVYYVECKRNAENRKIGVGIVKNLHSTVTADNVNGGIIVTTSYFSKDAQNFIRNNNLGYKIKMQDFTQIKKFLSMVV